MKKRNTIIDLMKGIGIIAVIIGHINDIPYMPYRHIMFSFHMPLFFIIAGWFHKESSDFRKNIKKNGTRLLYPYAFTALIMIIYHLVLSIKDDDYLDVLKHIIAAIYASGDIHHSPFLGNVRPIGAIWFLPALFWCKISFTYLRNKNINLFFIACISVLATICDFYIVNLPFSILPGLSAMMFYMIGYICKNARIPKFYFILCILLWPLSIKYSHIYMVQCSYKIYPLAILGACGGTIVVYLICKLLQSVKFVSIYLQWIGKMSLVILCWHMIESLCHVFQLTGLPQQLYVQVPFRIIIPIIFSIICTKISLTRKLFQI